MTTPFALGGGLALIVALGLAGYLAATPRGPLRRLIDDYLVWLGNELQRQRASTSAGQVLCAQCDATVALLVGGAAVSGYLWLAAPLPFALTRMALRRGAQQRVDAIEAQLGGWLVALANSLQVSGSIPDAMAQTLELTRQPLADEVDRTVKEIQFGATVDGALRDLSTRVGSSMLAAATTTLIVGRRTGGALPSLLERTAGVTRERQRLERVFRQQLASARIQFQALAIGPPLMVAGLDQMQPGFFEPLLASSMGNMIAAVCAVMYLTAILLARRIMASVV